MEAFSDDSKVVASFAEVHRQLGDRDHMLNLIAERPSSQFGKIVELGPEFGGHADVELEGFFDETGWPAAFGGGFALFHWGGVYGFVR